ncbi:hypothetical protein [Microbacterium sp. APC 3901]|uniref:hypothetical protein n=1 Tax=Microbacterium sp. APC 3901 TaxID=3035192 RepID=UPI0025B3EF40|nr:hypothetical protein [Microbacterium sp. APC 3901]MDN3443734.1 hypothetical protein [Microbacterium sp. APC 3901]
MKTSRAARTIHPFRTSGVNAPGYSRAAPQQAQQAPQQPQQPQQRAKPVVVTIGPGRPSARAQAHLDAVKDTRLVDPPRVPASATTTDVFIDGAKVSIPADWQIAFSSHKGKDTLYALEPNGTLHVLTLDAQGRLRELAGLSPELIADLFRWRFPRFKR